MTAKAATNVDPLELVSALIQIGNADTVYRDAYLRRAGTLMAGVLSVEEFQSLEQQTAELAALPVTIGRAVEKGDWPTVKKLSTQAASFRQALEAKRRQIEAGREVYAVTDVKLDPFSPGLRPFTRRADKGLLALRTQAVEHLATLQRGDAPWKDFYTRRRAVLEALALTTSGDSQTAAVSTDPREAAQHALKSGDMQGLAKLADTLMAAATPKKDGQTTQGPAARSTPSPEPPSTDLLTPYSDDTVKRARRFGLASRHLESRTELASLSWYAWNPLFSDAPGGRIEVKQVPLPTGTPEAFRERFEMLMIHPLVNSGGARHLPKLVAEDVLVEDFPDPKEGEETPSSELLAILRLPGRRGLPRIAIEQALLAHGADVLETQLGLNPLEFRLVCIPPDVHLRLGERESWGRQPVWTHFDGYIVMADGRLRALAGGDVRYGGLYHLLGISRDYDSDRVMARFAVVRRARMVAW
jgi:hypothetical protein